MSANPLGNKFQRNTLIKWFDELKYFNKIVSLTNTNNTFLNCTSLEHLYTYNITNVSAAASASPFYNTKIVNLYLPKIKTAGSYAFGNPGWVRNRADSSIGPLRIVVLGASLTNFTSEYSLGYVNLIDVFIYAVTPPTCSAVLLQNGYPNQIYVPDDSYDDYYNDANFRNVKGRLRMLSTYTGEKPWEELYPEELGLI